ncbi:alpha/beta hydrolase [Roseateles sp.]|uniref:alpha/beta hydrolase n=1 Tax=Roseateles sp. TaxID=1971397 RepID=UPI0031CE750F
MKKFTALPDAVPDPVRAAAAFIPSPSWALLGIEPLRAAMEYASCRLMDRSGHPPGDGHPVVVFPGLAADAQSVAPLVGFCHGLGYAARDWGRGVNTGPIGDIDLWLDALAADIEVLVGDAHQPVSLIGWSLGGIYAREVAKRIALPVRQVVTIGTPITGEAAQTNVSLLYRWVNGALPVLEEAFKARLIAAPPVPTTSIYSRSDGVVAWQACLQPEDHPMIENVEVDGSHCGLCWNPAVLRVVADRLANRPGAWSPYGATREAIDNQ